MKKTKMINEELRVAVVQTSLDPTAAWQENGSGKWQEAVKISDVEEEKATREIRHYLSGLRSSSQELDVVVLSELSVPVGFEKRLKKAAEDLETILIAGFDYRIAQTHPVPKVSNDALVIVPRVINGNKLLKATSCKRIGKTYPAPAERRKLDQVGVSFEENPTIWTFENDQFGTFGVAICYDFLDIDRIAMYRNKIQTLFILALNKDTNTFDHLAEAICRMIFCNVVVCNCGFFGGSYAVAPFKKAYKRAIYKNTGQELANSQIVNLPLRELKNIQERATTSSDFKSLPPGFDEGVHGLTVVPQSIP